MASNNFALTFRLSTSPPPLPPSPPPAAEAAGDDAVRGFADALGWDERGDLEIWDCVRTTKDSLDLVEG